MHIGSWFENSQLSFMMAIHLYMGMLMNELLSSCVIMIQMEYACAKITENVIFKVTWVTY
jgi:hypothetical protein